MKHNLSILSKTTVGTLLLIGSLSIFILHITLSLQPTITIGILFFLFLVATFLYNPLYGFLSLLILRVSTDFFSSYFSLKLTESISLNLASIFALLAIVLYAIFLLKYKRDIFTIPLSIPFFIFIVYLASSYFYSIDKNVTMQEVLRILSIFMTYLIAHTICTIDKNYRNLTLKAILLASIIPISLGLLQLATGTGATDSTGVDGRLFGTFKESNAFASFMLIIIAILLYNIFTQKVTTEENKLKIILLILSTTLLLLTFSRGGWLALIIFLGIFGAIKKPKILFISLGIFILLFFTSAKVHDRIEDIYNPPADSSIRWRAQQWNNAIDAWKLSPIYGYGAGTELAIHTQEQGYYAGNPYTHNDILKVLQENGIVGAILFAVLFLLTIIALLRKYLSLTSPNQKLLTFVILVLFIAELSFGMSSNIWRGTAVEWLLWTLVACALSIESPKKKLL